MPGKILGMDYVSPIKGKYLLVKMDYLSKLFELDVCNQADSGHSIDGVEKWESKRAPIQTVITDRAKHFINADMRRWVETKGVKHIKTLAYDHRSNRRVERCVHSVLQMLRKQQSAHLGSN